MGDDSSKFTVQIADGKTPAFTPRWEVQLRGAWHKYLQDVAKDERNPEEFIQLATTVAKTTKSAEGESSKAGEAAKGKVKQEKVEGKVKQEKVEAEAPKPAEGKGKKRKKSADAGEADAEDMAVPAAKAPKKKKGKKSADAGEAV